MGDRGLPTASRVLLAVPGPRLRPRPRASTCSTGRSMRRPGSSPACSSAFRARPRVARARRRHSTRGPDRVGCRYADARPARTPARRRAVRRGRRVPARPRAVRLGGRLGQPVGALDRDPARLRLLRDATSRPASTSARTSHAVMDEAEAGRREIPDHELLVGGFPCQDYSVAKTLNQAAGIEGKKGVLWWEIHRLLTMKRPPYLFLENVDRLLKSPDEAARARLRGDARDARRPRLRGRVAGRQRRRLRLPAEAPAGAPRRSTGR